MSSKIIKHILVESFLSFLKIEKGWEHTQHIEVGSVCEAVARTTEKAERM